MDSMLDKAEKPIRTRYGAHLAIIEYGWSHKSNVVDYIVESGEYVKINQICDT